MLELRNLSFGYPNAALLFKELNLQLKADENVLLKGENGSGKTSLLKLLMGMLPANTGFACLQGRSIKKLQAQMFAQVFYQGQFTQDNLLGISQKQDWQMWQIAIPTLPDYPFGEDKLFTERSTGEQKQDSQRILPYIMDKYWILDEPFTSLDSKATDALLQLLLAKMKHQPGMLIVAHEPAGLAKYFERVLSISSGKIMELQGA